MIWKITLPSKETYSLPKPPQNYKELVSIIQQKYNTQTFGPFCLKYIDSDDEFINLTSNEDLETAILSVSQDKLHTLQIFVLSTVATQLVAPQATSNNIPPAGLCPSDRKRRWTVYTRPNPAQMAQISQPKLLFAKRALNDKKVPQASQNSKNKRRLSCPSATREKLLDDNKPKKLERKQLDLLKVAAQKIDKKLQKEIKEAVPEIIGALQDILQPSPSHSLSSQLNKQSIKKSQVKLSPSIPFRDITNKMSLEDSFPDIFATRPRANTNIDKRVILPEPPKDLMKSTSVYKKSTLNPTTGYLSVCRNPLRKATETFKASVVRTIPEEDIESEPLESYKVTFQIKNCGTTKWPADVRLVCINGIHIGNEKMLPSLEPSRTITTELSLQAPKEKGKYLSQWRISYGKSSNQKSFGESAFEEVHVRGVEENSPYQKNKKSNRQSVSYEAGRQAQEQAEDDMEKKTPGGDVSSWNIKAAGIGENKLSSPEDKVKCARFLNEVFPGDLEEKMSFVNQFIKESTIFDAVEKYLVMSGVTKFCKKR